MKKLSILFLSALLAQAAYGAGETRVGDSRGTIHQGPMSVGTASAANSKTVLDVVSTTKAARPCPPMTTAQRDAITAPVNGSCIFNTDTGKQNTYSTTSSTWSATGSGSGGGVNFISQTTTWAVNTTDDRDLEASVGNWLAFDDAAPIPADLSAGTTTTTCTRSISDPLDGTASLLMTLTAANLQGEGCAVPFNVQPAYQGRNVEVSFPLSIVSGTYVNGDFEIWAYNVTKLAMMKANCSVFGAPEVKCTFPTTARDTPPVNHAYRLGIFRAVTTAAAVVLKADNFSISPTTTSGGLAGSNSTSFTMSVGAVTTAPTLGTASNNVAQWWRAGDRMIIMWVYRQTAAGAAGSGQYLLSIPSGYTIDTAKLPASTTQNLGGAGGASLYANLSARAEATVSAHNSTQLKLAGTYDGATAAGFAWGSAAFGFGNTDLEVSILANVPIVGWDANVSMGESSVKYLSSYLANGTHLTSGTPDQLGEYKCYLRNASARTYTNSASAAPATAPTLADGFKIYGTNGFTSADTNNEPSRCDFFIEPNKFYAIRAWSAAGRSGRVSTKAVGELGGSTGDSVGLVDAYDAQTGVLSLTGFTFNGSFTAGRVGLDENASSVTDAFIEIVTSNNPLFVGAGSLRSEIRLSGYAGIYTYAIRPNVTNFNRGTAFTYSDTGSDSYITINEDGLYSCQVKGAATNAAPVWLIDKDTAAGSLPAAESINSLAYLDGPNNAGWTTNLVTPVTFMAAGTRVRFKAANTPGALANIYYHCTKAAH